MRALALALAGLTLAGCLGAQPPDTPAPQDQTAHVDGTWASHAADPTPRYENAVVRSGGRIYTIAGLTGGLVATAIVEAYDPAADAWAPAPPFPFPAHHLAAVALDARGEPDAGPIYAFGSWVGIGQGASDRAFRLDPGAPAWTPLGAMPRARGAHAAAVLDGKVYLVGGTGAGGGLLGETDVFDPATGRWTTAAPLPVPRDHLALVSLGGKVYALGGRERTLASTTNESFVYDPARDAWTPIAPMAKPRGGFAAAVLDGSIVVAGGEDGSQQRVFPDAEIYDPRRDAWQTLPPMTLARTGNGAATWEGRVFVLGGGDPGGQPFNDRPESFGP
jgi:Kelch motif protein/galactose oxidase-like protein